MVVGISGSRKIKNRRAIYQALDTSPFKIDALWHGGAEGVDKIAGDWAKDRRIPCFDILPDYVTYDKYEAPKMRNISLAKKIEALIFVWEGLSGGTAHMVTICTALGMPIYPYVIPDPKVKKLLPQLGLNDEF